jgi:hypothetical protein
MTRPGPGRPERQRVILAHRRGTRMVHTRVEVAEQTGVGDALVRGLVRAQLGLAIRLALLTAGALAAVAVATTAVPGADSVAVAGIRLNWLILGVLVYPALYAVGRLYVRLAEQGESDIMSVIDQGEGP